MFGVAKDSLKLEVGNLSGKSGMHPCLLESVCDHFYQTSGPTRHGGERNILHGLSSAFCSSDMGLASPYSLRRFDVSQFWFSIFKLRYGSSYL